MTMAIRLEHANLCVRDVDETLRFVKAAFPEFEVRAEGKSLLGARWLHVGSDDTYLALTQATQDAPEPWVPYAGRPGTNHLGYEVSDVEGVRRRLIAAGYRDSTVPNAHPHRRRVYFRDRDDNDWEFVEYASDDPSERNDYALPD
jgi:catechol 2,3-dioxygenase-like lactoylglutathione lyase family enzyme